METVIDLPAELKQQVEVCASQEGRTFTEAVVRLVRRGLEASEPATAGTESSSAVKTDSETGLPYFECAPDAPISKLTSEEIYELIHQTQEKEDLERIGFAFRH